MAERCDPIVPQLHIVLERIDPSRNMARYYVLSLEPTLFGNCAVVRDWGRLGAPGRRRSEFFEDGTNALMALDVWLARKSKRGYVARTTSGLERR
jgi:predicted DNA-binding WGR domain protein